MSIRRIRLAVKDGRYAYSLHALDPCEYCGGRLDGREKLVTVCLHHVGAHFIFEGVPARVCPRCGERRK